MYISHKNPRCMTVSVISTFELNHTSSGLQEVADLCEFWIRPFFQDTVHDSR